MNALKKTGRTTLLVVVGIVLLVPLLFPLYWIIVASFQNLSTIYATPPAFWPAHLHLDNYSLAFGSILGNIGISLLISLAVTCLAWIIGVPAAYAMARYGVRCMHIPSSPSRKCGPRQPWPRACAFSASR